MCLRCLLERYNKSFSSESPEGSSELIFDKQFGTIFERKSGRSSETLNNGPKVDETMQKSSQEKKILKDSKSKIAESKKLAKHAKFDESNIKQTYHPPGKDYGHMKIDEPKTPYNRDEKLDPFMDPSQVAKKLMEGGKPKALMKRDQDDKAEEEIQKRKDFESKRKDHYDEFKRAKLAAEDDDDEEEAGSIVDEENENKHQDFEDQRKKFYDETKRLEQDAKTSKNGQDEEEKDENKPNVSSK